MKRVLLLTAVLTVCAGRPALAQFGSLMKSIAAGRGVSGAPADVDGFLLRAREAELLTRVSADGIFAAVESQAQVAEIQARRKANEAILDPKEKEAAQRKLDADVDATLAKVNWDEEQKRLASQAGSERTRHLGASMYNFALAVLRDQQLTTNGQEIASAVGRNPLTAMSMAGKLGQVKDASTAIGSQMGNLSKIAVGIPKLMTVAKVAQLPSSASTAPIAVAD